MHTWPQRWLRSTDWTLIATLLLLATISSTALYSIAHKPIGQRVPNHIVLKQCAFECLGLIAMFSAYRFDYRILFKYSKWIYGTSTFLLIVVFAMPGRFGAHSWIPLGLFSVQPSEFAKLALIAAVATYMTKVDTTATAQSSFKTPLIVGGLFIVPFALILKEPALGQALVMFAIVLFMYMSHTKRSQFFVILFLMVCVVVGASIVALKYSTPFTTFVQHVLIQHHILKAYQANRIIVWLNPSYHVRGAGYNVHMAETAIGSGQIFGAGFLNGIATNGGWVPNQWTDFIYTAIGEQFGFLGSALLILLYLILLHRLITIAHKTRDRFASYFVVGIVSMICFQVFENIGMDMYMSPATGITLPFVSYGGSALIIDYVSIGIALSINRMRFSSTYPSQVAGGIISGTSSISI